MSDEHDFALVLNGLPEAPPVLLGITFTMEDGLPIAFCEIQAAGLGHALALGIRTVEVCGQTVLRIIDEDLVTLGDIARRVGASREAIRRYSTADRGPGGFPPPATPRRDGATFYRWTEVAAWFDVNYRDLARAEGGAGSAGAGFLSDRYASTLAYANLLLQARNLRGIDGGDPLIDLIAEGLPA